MLIVKKVEPGWNHFDGYTALQYARLRAIDDDWHRVARQRTVIQRCWTGSRALRLPS